MNDREQGPAKERTIIGSVVKALNVLSEVGRSDGGVSASEVADALDMPAPSAYHVLTTLTAAGALTKGADRRYRLGPLIGALSGAYYSQTAPDERLLRPLVDLAEQTGETAYLTGWHDREIEVIASVEGNHAVRIPRLERGAHGYAHARASGKLLLALAPAALRDSYLAGQELVALTQKTIVKPTALRSHLAEIEAAGYATDEEEFAVGVSCVAVPVMHDGLLVGAYAVSVPTDRFNANRAALLAAVRGAAAAAGDLPRA
jgi:IclR family transcriptional regulator, acetate operon repressor